jgi:hypothetical protein
MNFGIGKITKKKKSTAKKRPVGRPKKVVAKTKGRKPTAGSKISAKSGERYFPSTPKKSKSYKATKTCSVAGSNLKKGVDTKVAGAILALCKASVKANNLTAAALKKYGVRRSSLSRKK